MHCRPQGMRSFSATKVDIWAAGVTLYYMVEGSVPFKGQCWRALLPAFRFLSADYVVRLGGVLVTLRLPRVRALFLLLLTLHHTLFGCCRRHGGRSLLQNWPGHIQVI